MKKCLKFFILAFLAIVLAFSFVACGGGNDDPPVENPPVVDPPSGPSTATTLYKPENIRIEFDGGRWMLKWDAVANAVAYTLTFNSENYDVRGTTSQDVSSHIANERNGKLYEMSIFARGDGRKYSNSDAVTAQIPAAPVTSNLQYTLIDNGQAYEVSKGNLATIFQYLTIPHEYEGKPVTQIAEDGFVTIENLAYVTLPTSIKVISDRAFDGCDRLKVISMPEGLETIGEYVFRQNRGLYNIAIPTSVTSIGAGAFMECTNLLAIDLDMDTEEVPANLFNGCVSLVELNITSPIKKVGDFAFYNCNKVEHIGFIDNLTYIGVSAFYGCTGFTSVNINANITFLGETAFYDCKTLTEISLPDGFVLEEANIFTSSGWYDEQNNGMIMLGTMLYGYKRRSGGGGGGWGGGGGDDWYDITIPETTTIIAGGAFNGREGFRNIVIPISVKIIGKKAFNYTSLRTVTFAEGESALETIGNFAFANCDKLRSIVIPKSVKKIAGDAVYNSGSAKICYVGTQAEWQEVTIVEATETSITAANTYFYRAEAPEDISQPTVYWYYNSYSSISIWGVQDENPWY